MSFEIEKRFKNFNYKNIKQLLKINNIKKEGSYLYKIIMFHSLKEGQIIRIRDEGTKITFTIKQKNPNNYSTEYEVIVNDYMMIEQMLYQLNITKNYDLHKIREIYRTSDNNSEIIFDHYPGLPPYIEIESKTENELNKLMKVLGLKDEKSFHAGDLYTNLYNITKDRKNESLTFNNATQIFTPYILKNKEKFLKRINIQIKFLQKKKLI